MYDVIIQNGLLIDGTGKTGFAADLAVKDGKIVKIGQIREPAERTIDARGLVVTPGFIDSHSHADSGILRYPDQWEKLEQGITTSVCGQCGNSAAPVLGGVPERCSVGAFLDAVGKLPLGANFMLFVGHGTLRKAVMGAENRKPTPAEQAQMEQLLAESFQNGGAGLSFGLFYAPGCYADTEEVLGLAKVAAAYGRPVAAHIRSESDQLIEAVAEFIHVIRTSGARGILSHHKAAQKPNWGKVETTLAMLRQAVAEGVDIYCDVYPYCASSTGFSQLFIPKDWRDGGTERLLERMRDPVLCETNKRAFLAAKGEDLSWVMVTKCAPYPQYQGMRLDKIAQLHGKDPFNTAMDLIYDSGDTCKACFFSIREADLEQVLAWERTMIGTDGGLVRGLATFHPRVVGTFPRALGRYVRELGVVSLPEMIRKMTALPASVYGLESKGILAEGYDADICVFDPETIADRTEFTGGVQRASGLSYVIVGGQVAVEDACHNGTCAGRLSRF